MKWLISALLTFFWSTAQSSIVYKFNFNPSNFHWAFSHDMNVNAISITPDHNKPLGTILFIHGFGDRWANHEPLINEWVEDGFQVVAFDLPSHGETTGDGLSSFSFNQLARLVESVAMYAGVKSSRPPLLIAGWSTGGLLATRIAQALWDHNFYKVSGLILFAPGISVPYQVGEPSLRYPLGQVTARTLTHKSTPPHKANPIQPKSPGSTLRFAIKLKINSWLSQLQVLPKKIPTLVLLSGDKEDLYVNTPKVKSWAARQIAHGADIKVVQFPNARHELDNETITHGGPRARREARDFALEVVKKVGAETPCSAPLARRSVW